MCIDGIIRCGKDQVACGEHRVCGKFEKIEGEYKFVTCHQTAEEGCFCRCNGISRHICEVGNCDNNGECDGECTGGIKMFEKRGGIWSSGCVLKCNGGGCKEGEVCLREDGKEKCSKTSPM